MNPVAEKRRTEKSQSESEGSEGNERWNVLVDPSSGNLGSSIERGDSRIGEKSSQDRSDESSHSVKSESIDCVVDTEEYLDSSGVVACLDEENCQDS